MTTPNGDAPAGEVTLVRRARPLLGTIVEIALATSDEGAFEQAFAAIAGIHALMSFHEADSDLARVRRAMPGETVKVSHHTATVLRAAIALHRETNGIFDVSVGRHLVAEGFLPRNDVIHLNRFKGTMDDLEVLDDSTIRLQRRMLIDLGGIAKGYAVDLAIAALRVAGIGHGIVNAGGDMRVFGTIAQPIMLRTGQGDLLSAGTITEGAIASSENMRTRHRSRGLIATPHIGTGGRAVQIDTLVSVMADTCMIADAMTKVAMVDASLADRLLAKHGGRVLLAASTASR